LICLISFVFPILKRGESDDDADEDGNGSGIPKYKRYFKRMGLLSKYKFDYFKFPEVEHFATSRHRDKVSNANIYFSVGRDRDDACEVFSLSVSVEFVCDPRHFEINLT
jgi:hypothetical protein